MSLIDRLRHARGPDGRRLFAIPIALSSSDPAWRALDRLTFAAWLREQGYRSPHLLWYLNYCCRDDYGADLAHTSAWAGLHYFCARAGQAENAEAGAVLTWPNGLATLANALSARAGLDGEDRRRSGYAVRVQAVSPQSVVAHCMNGSASYLVRARRAICAMPLHVAARVVQGLDLLGFQPAAHLPPSAAWLIANFHMKAFPREQAGAPLAWDNLVLSSQGLGWVVSTHQDIRQGPPPRTVFTAYDTLSDMTPYAARAWMERASPEQLLARAGADLRAAYGEALPLCCERVDITLRGHGMASPAPGFLSNPGLLALRQAPGPILFAHSDLSGYSVFEEAAWWGDRAARLVLADGKPGS